MRRHRSAGECLSRPIWQPEELQSRLPALRRDMHPPGDFAAWMEVFLAGEWHMFDPRNNKPRSARILIAPGRDAADVPLTQTFGQNTLTEFKVWTDELA